MKTNLLLICCILAIPNISHARVFVTSVTAVENPMSQGGAWLQGGADGLDWKNIRTSSGVMNGEDAPVAFSDPHAVLKGNWGINQYASAVAYCFSPDDTQFQEVEILLRHVVSAHVSRGIEVNWRCSGSAAGYSEGVFWNGALADFNAISHNDGATFSVVDGDIISATAIGPTISVYKNNTFKYSFVDPWFNFYSTNSVGSPGVGFNYHDQAVKHSEFGIKAFTATDDRGVISTSLSGGVTLTGGVAIK